MTNSKKNKGIIVVSLSEKIYRNLSKISFAKTRLPKNTYTDTHFHWFISLYLVYNMGSLVTNDTEIPMPKRALVIVLPFCNHTWSNKKGSSKECYIADLSPVHGKHLIYE